ncbi:CCCH zinc finger in TRM13 protein [Leishmania braziliensis]|nr:CCCH zinc finger in TRM13 protein [Leishmania braziliensis]
MFVRGGMLRIFRGGAARLVRGGDREPDTSHGDAPQAHEFLFLFPFSVSFSSASLPVSVQTISRRAELEDVCAVLVPPVASSCVQLFFVPHHPPSFRLPRHSSPPSHLCRRGGVGGPPEHKRRFKGRLRRAIRPVLHFWIPPMTATATHAEAGASARNSPKVQPPTQNPDPNFCSYYVTRKHRFCRTQCRPGSLYCCTHNVEQTGPTPSAAPQSAKDVTSCQSDAAGYRGDMRVPCPINSNHTVYASRLEKHIKVCPDLRYVTQQLPYFSEDKHANRGAVFVSSVRNALPEGKSQRYTHRDLSVEDLAALICKVHECYDSCIAPDLVILRQPLRDRHAASGEPAATPTPEETASFYNSASVAHGEVASQKHGPQHMGLLRCLSDVIRQVHDTDSILVGRGSSQRAPVHVDGFLEFGAGKGGLSVALQQLIVQRLQFIDSTTTSVGESDEAEGVASTQCDAATETSPSTPSAPLSSLRWDFLAEVAQRPPLVVLDMDGFRRKGDARVRHTAVPLQRLRINIKDVDLTRAFLSEIRPVPSGEVEVAAGTVPNAISRPLENWAVLGKHLCGACTDFALSCFTENPVLISQAQVQLPILVIATCCHHRCELKHVNPPEQLEVAPAPLVLPGTSFTWSEMEFAALASMSSWAVCGNFVDEERRTVGRKCKRIIDQLRVHFLRRLGYVAFQCQYTTRDVTEENVCLVAFQAS